MSRHPELGAGHPDNLDLGPGDRDCDYCGTRIYVGELRRVKLGSISWICESCYQRGQARYDEMTAANRILADAFGGEDDLSPIRFGR